MAVYLISYDVADKDAFEYDGLYAELKQLGAVRVLYSEWVLPSTRLDSLTIYDKLRARMQDKDRLLVNELASEAAWENLVVSDDKFRALLANARR